MLPASRRSVREALAPVMPAEKFGHACGQRLDDPFDLPKIPRP